MSYHSKLAVVEAPYQRPSRCALLLELAGPLRLSDTDGEDLTPRARKAQGLLALIGTSPNLRRSRAWVQDKLWSDRGAEQGAASLRQCLTEIRSTLGRHVGCLRTEAGWIALDPERVRVSTELDGEVEFLEGLDIRDPEFEHWLRDQRVLCSARCGTSAVCVANDPSGPSRPLALRRAMPLTIALAAHDAPGADHAEEMVNDLVLDLIAKKLLGHGRVDVLDFRGQRDLGFHSAPLAKPDWLLYALSSVRGDRVVVTLSFMEVEAKHLLWTDAATFDLAEFYQPEQAAIGALVQRAASVVHDRTPHPALASGRTYALERPLASYPAAGC